LKDLVLKTKFIPPEIKGELFIDQGLNNKLNKVANYPLTVVKAGPGFGKSTVLSYYFNRIENRQVFWYSIDELDTDAPIFLLNILSAFSFQEPDLAEQARKILTKGEDSQLDLFQIIDILFNNLLQNVSTDIFLVLDNYQLLTHNEQINHLMAYFINMLPPRLHLVIASREKLLFKDWPRWIIKDKVLLITEELLSLSEGEIVNFFQNKYKQKLDEIQIKRVWQKTEGWVMGLDLIGHGLVNGIPIEDLFTLKTGSLDILFQYLAYDVLEKHEDQIKEFLIKTSVLKYLKSEVCNRLLNINNSSDILQKLVDKGLFLHKHGSQEYRYNPLFHDFLRNQAREKYSSEDLHQKVADICLELNFIGLAIYHSLKSKDFYRAAGLIEESADKMIKLGRLDSLQAGLEEIPEEIYQSYPDLYIYLGDVYRLRNNFNLSIKIYQKAERFFRENGEKLKLSRVLQKLAMVYLDTIEPAEADRYLKEAIKLRDEENLWEETVLLKLLAENKANEGQLREAEVFQKRAEKLSDSYVFHNNLKARVKLRTGRLQAAKEMLNKKINDEKNGPLIPRSHRASILILSLISSFEGKPEEARQAAEKGLQPCEIKSPFNEAVAYMRLGHAYQISGRYNIFKARNAYKSALEIIDKLKINRGKAEPLMGLALVEGYYGDPYQGIKYGEEGFEISENSGDEWLAGLLKISIGINYYFANDLQEAEEIFNEASKYFKNSNDNYCLAVTKMWLSLIAYQLEDWVQLPLYITDLFELSEAGGYDYLFLKPTLFGVRDPNIFAPVLLEAYDGDTNLDYIKKLIEELNLSETENHPGYSLYIKSFGNLKVWRGQKEITTKEWQREKARELFLLFLVQKGEYIPKERIYYLLWPGSNEKTAKRNFKVTLNALKKALEPDRKPRQKPFFIKRRSSSYGFNEKSGYIYDVEEFEELIAYGNNESDFSHQMEYYELAVELYESDFLASNLYIEWARNERERLRNLFLNTATKLLEYNFELAKYERTIKIANKILDIDNCWEQAYFFKMKAYQQMKNRSMAIKTYHKYKDVIYRELQVDPMADIEAYFQEVIS